MTSANRRKPKLEREIEAMDLFSKGLTFDQISTQMGYKHRSSACRLVNSRLRDQLSETVESSRELQVARYEALLGAHWDKALTGNVRSARVVCRVLARLDAVFGLVGTGAKTNVRSDDEPWGVVMTPARRKQWEADGSPTVWHSR